VTRDDEDAEGTITTPDGVQLHYRVAGTGPVTVVVPGAAFDADLEPLSERHRVVFYDARNRGRSESITEPARLGFYREVDDLEHVRAHLGLERVALLGWSYNAGIAACYALTRTVRVSHLVLVAPIAPRSDFAIEPAPPPPPHLLAHLDQLRADGLEARDPEAYCREWRKVYVPVLMGDATRFTDLVADPCGCANEWPEHVTRALAHVFLDLGIYDWSDALRQLDTPTLVVHGEQDQIPIASAEAWADLLPASRLLALPAVGHFPWVESPGTFFDAISTFLDGSWPDATPTP
jgi:pimeloyl-ACP methyl ester carboxylesterase